MAEPWREGWDGPSDQPPSTADTDRVAAHSRALSVAAQEDLSSTTEASIYGPVTNPSSAAQITLRILGPFAGGLPQDYAYEEVIQEINDGTWSAVGAGRDSVSQGIPAREANAKTGVLYGTIALAALDPSGEYWRFYYGSTAPGSSLACQITYVKNVCPTIVAGIVTAISVEYETFDTARCAPVSGFCVVNPTGCCGVSVPCCPGTSLPSVLPIIFQDAGTCPCLNGLATSLIWDGQFYWVSPPGLTSPCFGGAPVTIRFSCCDVSGGSGKHWCLVVRFGTGQDCGFFATATSWETCSPFCVAFDGWSWASFCQGSPNCTFTGGPPSSLTAFVGACSGSPGGGGGPGANCCPGVSVPTTLHATVLNSTSCTCIPAGTTFTLTYDAPSNTWISGGLTCGAKTITFTLVCRLQAAQYYWFLQATCAGSVSDPHPASAVSCSPFSLSFDGIGFSPACDVCTGPLQILITS